MMRALAGMAGAACWFVGNCSRSPPPILFHSDAGQPAIVATDAAPPVDAGRVADAGHVEPLLSNAVPGDGTTLTLDGVTLRANASERMTRYVAMDPDGDGDRDVVVIRAAGQAIVGLGFFRREPAGFVSVPVTGGDAPTDPRCADAQLRSTSSRAVVVTYRCPAAPAPGAAIDPAQPGGTATLPFTAEHVVVAFAPTAQVRMRVGELPTLDGTVMDVAVETGDRDGDARDDIVVNVGARGLADRPDSAARASVVWLDRPAGIARDTSAPEASFVRLVAQARSQANRRGAGIAAVERIVRLRRVLCSDAGAPRVRLGGENGVNCATSAALRSVPDAWAHALVAAGEIPAALAATRPESAIEFGVANATRLRAELRRVLPAQAGVAARRGPFAPPSLESATYPRSSAMTLEPSGSPTNIAVHVEPPARVDLNTLALATDTTIQPDAHLRSPDGARTLAGFFETCEGIVAAVCPSSQVECVSAPPRADALPQGAESWRITDLIAPEHAATCLREGGSNVPPVRATQLRALGFSADGLLLSHRGRVLRVARGGATVTSLGGAPLGAPYAPGSSVSPTGSYLAMPGIDGILVRDAAGRWRMWSDPQLVGRYPQMTDLVVSDDGRTVVGLVGTQVWVLQHDVMRLAPPTITPVQVAPDAAAPPPPSVSPAAAPQ